MHPTIEVVECEGKQIFVLEGKRPKTVSYYDRATTDHYDRAADHDNDSASTDHDNIPSASSSLSGSSGKLFTDDCVGQLLPGGRVLLER